MLLVFWNKPNWLQSIPFFLFENIAMGVTRPVQAETLGEFKWEKKIKNNWNLNEKKKHKKFEKPQINVVYTKWKLIRNSS